jgi:ABC-type multidrug transport system fused ATPase/permease subunit
MLYARHAEQGRPVHLFNWTLDLTAWGGGGLFACGAVVALLGLLSAVFQFFTDNLILATARDYHHACAERAMTIIHDPLCRGWQLLGHDERETPRQIAARMIGGAARHTALALRDMLRIILPALTFLAAVGFLFWIDLTVTLVVLPIALLYLLPLYLINRQVTHRQKRYRALSRKARSEVSQALRARMLGGPMTSPVKQNALESILRPLRADSFRGALGALYGRLLADRRTHMLNTSFFVACLVALLVFFGAQSREHGRPWSDLLFYLVALRFAVTSLRQVTTLVGKFSRFFPEYRSYGTFVRQAMSIHERRIAAGQSDAPTPQALTWRIGRKPQWESPRVVRVNRAEGVLWVLTPLPPEFVDLEALAARLEQLNVEEIDLASNAEFIVRASDCEARSREIAAAQCLLLPDDVLPRRAVQEALSACQGYVVIVSARPDAALLSIQERKECAAVIVLDGGEVLGGGDAAWLKFNIVAIAKELGRRADLSHQVADDLEEDEHAE